MIAEKGKFTPGLTSSCKQLGNGNLQQGATGIYACLRFIVFIFELIGKRQSLIIKFVGDKKTGQYDKYCWHRINSKHHLKRLKQ